MKPAWEWEEADIGELIRDKVEESITLDYKASASLKKDDPRKISELTKDVSAFANSAGGTIIYGVFEDPNDKRFPGGIDEGVDPSIISREWLEQIVNGRIQRRIDGVRIKPISLSGPKAGRVIYVISVPQSPRAPHMAGDKRFYKRFNFQSVPMEEYEVRDVARRLDVPDLHIDVDLQRHDPLGPSLVIESAEYYPVELKLDLTNRSPTPAEYYVVFLNIDQRLKLVQAGDFSSGGATSISVGNLDIPVHEYQLGRGIPSVLPIWEGIQHKLTNNPFIIAFPNCPGSYLVRWEVQSPRMSLRGQSYNLSTLTFGRIVSLSARTDDHSA